MARGGAERGSPVGQSQPSSWKQLTTTINSRGRRRGSVNQARKEPEGTQDNAVQQNKYLQKLIGTTKTASLSSQAPPPRRGAARAGSRSGGLERLDGIYN